jgi:hypothetical protein
MSEYETPPRNLKRLPGWIKSYLAPKGGSQAFRAHQFTINGVTYPFVRHFHFAAVPYPINRRYSMLAGLFVTRPGDLLFFFQSDPQWSNDDINSRRGLRGIYRIVSEPFHDPRPIRDQKTGYKVLGRCPNCGSPNANLSESCIKCDKKYPSMVIPSKGPKDPYQLLVLGCRIDLEPVVVFERSVSDERAYADMSDTGMIWIGRHDNQMGAGKGSSIRQLLPEEAVKITRLMLTEPGQHVSFPKKKKYPNPKMATMNPDGKTPAEYMEIKKRSRSGDMLVKELELNYHIAKTIDDPNSNIRKALGRVFDNKNLEYFSSEFPWGYTAGESDFICSFANRDGRYKIIVMEFKRDWVDDDTAIQVSLYVPWVVQIMSQFAVPTPTSMEIVPVFIGRRIAEGTCRPKEYAYRGSFNSGVKVDVTVASPICIEYVPDAINEVKGVSYATDIEYLDRSRGLRKIDWRPPIGLVTSQIERDWARESSWADAKRR